MAARWNIAIVGAGALGGHVGAYLTRAGERVTLIDPWPEHVEKMRRDGLTLRGQTAAENFTVPVKAIHLTELQDTIKGEPFDMAFVAMKSYDTLWATEMIKPYLGEKLDGLHLIFFVLFVVFLLLALFGQLLNWNWRTWLPGAEGAQSTWSGVKSAVYNVISHLS